MTLAETHQSFDLIAESMTCMLAVSFPKSRSASYDIAVSFAQQAQKYTEAHVKNSLFHFAAFGSNREQAARALSLVRALRSAKGFQVYSGGKLIQNWARVERVLICYLESCGCNDHRAHCYISVNKDSLTGQPIGASRTALIDVSSSFEIANSRGNAYIFPCRLIALNFMFKFQPGHPSSDEDQLQAGAVREGCDWCPHFSAKEIKTS